MFPFPIAAQNLFLPASPTNQRPQLSPAPNQRCLLSGRPDTCALSARTEKPQYWAHNQGPAAEGACAFVRLCVCVCCVPSIALKYYCVLHSFVPRVKRYACSVLGMRPSICRWLVNCATVDSLLGISHLYSPHLPQKLVYRTLLYSPRNPNLINTKSNPG